MPNQNLIPYSNTAGNTPSSLVNGQLGVNQANGRLFYRNSSGAVTEYGPALFAALSHAHGNINSDGSIGSAANRIVVTGTNGVATTAAIGSNLTLSGGTLSASGGGGGTTTDASALTSGTLAPARLPSRIRAAARIYAWSAFR